MIGDREKQALADLAAIIESLDLTVLLVGAGARFLIFDLRFKVEGRGTKDWDVAIPLESWQDYQTLCETLVAGNSPCFKTTEILHRFEHVATQITVDIVPFGKIGEPSQEIVWPCSGNLMNVLGFSEAMSQAESVQLSDDFAIRVVNISSFIVLKVFAWGDRGERTNKDLEDIELILARYEDDERAYEELSQQLASGEINLLDASIYLLGQDIGRKFQQNTLLKLNELLERLIQKYDGDEVKSLGYNLKILQRGIQSAN
ncbi:MAG: hypothetical protein HC890_13160 [Chloroflexaceae bacterium]|nr:hypothetical protein [Chloroflexaceae bacterium]